MQCVVDRFEGDYAVIEYFDRVLQLPRVFLPVETREGAVLDIIVMLDEAETDKIKAEVKKLVDTVWE